MNSFHTAYPPADTRPSFGEEDIEPVEGDDDYRSVSRMAVASAVFAVMGLLGFLVVPLLLLPLVGLVCAAVAFRSFKAYPDELIGKKVAVFGGVVAALTLAVAVPMHYYIYLTEVPEGYERLDFAVLKSPYNAPDVPPPAALGMDGKKIFVKGYIFPSSVSSSSAKSFILVPDFATCCFGSQPPLTHMIQVNLMGDLVAKFGMRRYKLAGTLRVDPTLKPVQGVDGVYYTLNADYIR